jgi:multidrug efflux pump subunit AcrA (membrane-fusion protein)
MKNITKSIPTLIILLLIIHLFTLENCNKKSDSSESDYKVGAPVKVTNPKFTDFIEYSNFNGTTIFQKKEIIRAPVQGFIVKVYKNIGDEVKPGETLFQMNTKESEANDSLQIKLGENIFKGKINITAKTQSIFTVLNHNIGDYVSEGEQLAVISDPHSLKIQLNLPYQYVPKIRLNKKCDVILPNGNSEKAIIQKSIPSIEPTSQTQIYILQLERFINLPENLNVTIRIPMKTFYNTLVLPKSAIMTNETMDDFWVMKVIDDTTAIKINVTKGIENDSLVQIVSPLFNPNEIIISDGAYGLADTSKILIQNQ